MAHTPSKLDDLAPLFAPRSEPRRNSGAHLGLHVSITIIRNSITYIISYLPFGSSRIRHQVIARVYPPRHEDTLMNTHTTLPRRQDTTAIVQHTLNLATTPTGVTSHSMMITMYRLGKRTETNGILTPGRHPHRTPLALPVPVPVAALVEAGRIVDGLKKETLMLTECLSLLRLGNRHTVKMGKIFLFIYFVHNHMCIICSIY
jgi:hypothetical protein